MSIREEDVRVPAGRPTRSRVRRGDPPGRARHLRGGGLRAASASTASPRAPGVGKATIYRRYSSKAELVVEAVRCGAQLDDWLPDTGDLRADLTSMMQPLLDRLRGDDAKLLTTFAVERLRDPELARAVRPAP